MIENLASIISQHFLISNLIDDLIEIINNRGQYNYKRLFDKSELTRDSYQVRMKRERVFAV